MVKTVTIGARATYSHAFPVLTPRGLVDVDHPRLPDVLVQLGDGAVKRHGGLPSELGDQAQQDRQPEQVAGDLLGRALAQPIAPGQQAEHGVQAGAEGPGGHARWYGPACGGAASGAAQAMEPILRDHRLDRRHLGDLMANGWASSPARPWLHRRQFAGLQSKALWTWSLEAKARV
jgi:hypothetical protein